jgi:predicted 2-oxoglutarate/Fe(II)-dependent dioxygenase YbiX
VNQPESSANQGLFLLPGFLDAPTCAGIRESMKAGQRKPGHVLEKGAPIVDEQTRRTKVVRVPDLIQADLAGRILALRPRLEAHFALSLTAYQPPLFLAYQPGDFFVFHRDRNNEPDEPPFVTARKVSIVVFLNEESEDGSADTYQGGALQFYAPDLFGPSAQSRTGYSLRGKTGLLVGFLPTIRHQVREVVRGQRYTAVTWFV